MRDCMIELPRDSRSACGHHRRRISDGLTARERRGDARDQIIAGLAQRRDLETRYFPMLDEQIESLRGLTRKSVHRRHRERVSVKRVERARPQTQIASE